MNFHLKYIMKYIVSQLKAIPQYMIIFRKIHILTPTIASQKKVPYNILSLGMLQQSFKSLPLSITQLFGCSIKYTSGKYRVQKLGW